MALTLSSDTCNPLSVKKFKRNTTDKRAAINTKYPKVFTGLGKLKNFQLKLHVDESVTPIAKAMRRIPFSRKQKVIDKLEELEAYKLD